jgi:DNA-binding winged helix-turn-helix (wHTH) protein/TolB-like protein/tetratricopeptide (TPR) repeat protein
MPLIINSLYQFGSFKLDPAERLLFCDERVVSLTPKAFDMLVFLVERSGHLLEKDELMRSLWPESFVEEDNLYVTVSLLRKVLGDDRGHQKYIETVSKRGYRFVPAVNQIDKKQDLASSEQCVKQKNTNPQTVEDGASRPSWKIFNTRLAWRVLTVSGIFCITLLSVAHVIRVRGGTAAPPEKRTPIKSLAVLPFQVIGQNIKDEYVGIAMADALITKLGAMGKFITRPTSAVQKYVTAPTDSRTAGLEQAVDAVLEGRMQREGDNVRLTAQLTRVHDGLQLWADSFDEKFIDVFALEDRFSDRVARSIRLQLTGEETGQVSKISTRNDDAYQSYIRGRYFWNKRTEKALIKGLEYFREAVRLDPSFAEAHAGVADSYALLGLYGLLPPKEAFPSAEYAAKKALSIDSDLAEAHATLGFVYFYYDWNGVAAEKEFRLALASNPTYAMAHSWNGQNLAAMQRFSEAVTETKLAQQQDPLSLIVSSNAGQVLSLAGKQTWAIETFRKALEIDPNFPRLHLRLGNAYEEEGMVEKAISEYEQAVRLSDGDSTYEGSLGHAYAVAGKVEKARTILALLKKRARQQYVPAYSIALVYEGLQDRENAFRWLEKAYTDRSASMALLKVDPALNSLRWDSRFAELARRVNF